MTAKERETNTCKYSKANKCELMGGTPWNFGTDDCNGKNEACAMCEQTDKQGEKEQWKRK